MVGAPQSCLLPAAWRAAEELHQGGRGGELRVPGGSAPSLLYGLQQPVNDELLLTRAVEREGEENGWRSGSQEEADEKE